jgi:hypothetical protein
MHFKERVIFNCKQYVQLLKVYKPRVLQGLKLLLLLLLFLCCVLCVCQKKKKKRDGAASLETAGHRFIITVQELRRENVC